jgi:hypothetical protein
MLVSGGRFGWTWIGSGTALVGIASSLATAACGSRTSMLDPDVYATGGSGGSGSTSNPSGGAGKPTTGGGLIGTAGARNNNPVSNCPRSGDGGFNPNCVSIYSCAAGPYVTFCASTESMQFAECGCAAPNGATKNLRVPIDGDLCFDATALCP